MTNEKDHGMIEYWDDRARRVERNRGTLMDAQDVQGDHWVTIGMELRGTRVARVLLNAKGEIIGEAVPKEAHGHKVSEWGKNASEEMKGTEKSNPSKSGESEGSKPSREYRPHQASMSTEEAERDLVTVSKGKLSNAQAKSCVASCESYSDGGYKDIRSGKSKQDMDHRKNLDRMIDALPKFKGDVYRGMTITEEQRSLLVKGASIDMDGISSWSSSERVAKGYAGTVGSAGAAVLFHLPNSDKGASITHLSMYGDKEEEVLFSSLDSKYEVESVRITTRKDVGGAGQFIITLKESR